MAAGAAAQADDFLIVPGERIGALKLPATEADVMRVFQGNAYPAMVPPADDGNDDFQRATVIFPCDPARTAFLYYDAAALPRIVSAVAVMPGSIEAVAVCLHFRDGAPDPLLRDQLPGDAVPHGTASVSAKFAWEKPALDQVAKEGAFTRDKLPQVAWHLANGASVGMTVADLQKLNGRPFILYPPGEDAGGRVADWRGGSLADCLWAARFQGMGDGTADGTAYRSDDPVLAKDPGWVAAIEIYAKKQSHDAGCPDPTDRKAQ